MAPSKRHVSQQLEYNKDIEIPVPWGHLAAKTWGTDDGLPVLALHGWQDNAGSFDTLAPLLPPNIHLVCLDFSGHGLSSHYPTGKFMAYYDYVYQVKLVIDYFKWKKVVIMGHSMGSMVGGIFTSMYPEIVLKMITLDKFGRHLTRPDKTISDQMRASLINFMVLSEKKENAPPSPPLTYAEARNKVLNNYKHSNFQERHADILLVRGLKRRSAQDEWEFTRDLRTIYTPFPFTHFTSDQIKAIARGITCPYLIVNGRQSDTQIEPEELVGELYDIYRNSSEDFRLVEVSGSHHVHLTNPELVAPHIYNFLSPFKAKL